MGTALSYIRKHAIEFIFGVLFGLVTCLCESYARTGFAGGLAASPLRTLGLFLLCAIAGTIVAIAAFAGLDRLRDRSNQSQNVPKKTVRLIFVLSCAVLAVCWLPWIIAFFPGSIVHDAVKQLQSFYGMIPWTTHHPVFATLIMGACTELGYLLTGTSEGALFAYTVFFYLLQIVVCALVAKEAVRISRIPTVGFAITAFFAVAPLFGSNAQTIWKDGLYMCLFALFFLCYAQVLFSVEKSSDAEKPSRRDLIVPIVKLFACALLVALARKEGLYVVVLSLVALVIVNKNMRIGAIACLIALVLSTCAWNAAVKGTGIEDGARAEGMSIMLQHIARLETHFPDTITDEERAVLSECFEHYAELPERYTPLISDPVKEIFIDEKVDDFLGVYKQIALRNPIRLFDSIVASSYGYFYVGMFEGAPPMVVTFIDPLAELVFPYDYQSGLAGIRNALSGYGDMWTTTPILAQLMQPGLYTWLVILLLTYSLRKRSIRHFALLIPLGLTIAAACLSPVNGYLRYILGAVISLPLALAYFSCDCNDCEIE